MQSNSDYKKFAERTRRFMPIYYAVAWMASHERFKDVVLANQNFQKARVINNASNKMFPKTRSGFDWAMDRFVDPTLAEKHGQNIAKRGASGDYRQINRLASPANVGGVVDHYFRLLAFGREEDAKSKVKSLEKFEYEWPFKPEDF